MIIVKSNMVIQIKIFNQLYIVCTQYTGVFKDKLMEFARNFASSYVECEVKCSTFPDLLKLTISSISLEKRGEQQRQKSGFFLTQECASQI